MSTASIELPVIGGEGVLTHSREQTYKTCARKHYYSYELGIRPIHTADPLRKGSGFHAGLEALKSGMPESAAVDVVRDMYAKAEVPPWLTQIDFEVETETVIAMVRGWSRRWGDDRITQYIAVELPFNVPIVNPLTGRETPTFRSAGKIDAIAKLPDGRIAIVEHKTCGEAVAPESDYWRRLMLDSQISRYVMAARSLGYDVETTVYDVTRKPSIAPKGITKADRALATANGNYFGIKLTTECPERETPAMYGARLLADMIDRPEFYFARCEIPRLDTDIEEFRAEQWSIQRSIRQAELDARSLGAAAWPRNTAACLLPRCPYFDICRGMHGDPAESVPNGFRRVRSIHQELAPA